MEKAEELGERILHRTDRVFLQAGVTYDIFAYNTRILCQTR